MDDISNDNIEATSAETFNDWDYNSDNVITPLEVLNNVSSTPVFPEADIS